ncbi:Ino eighty subunit 1 [Lentinula edodes]|uniref:Ino eighty subunit 1 n=1 Tax=Lentinula edodes TaxID=5353 RepID=A0A1Q3EQ77_LENED|nr:Ino eighty subunit 1 [Lentinula edodes]
MSSRRQSPKILKKSDNAPLTRADLQYDLLASLFSDTNEVFTDPFPSQLDNRAARSRVTFRNLYVNAIMNSPKASKLLKDKMSDTPEFATHFAMLSLLTNVGRINTTMSFFPEMKTTIRTYHPVPALQRTSGSLQDAPRLKSILKALVYDCDSPKLATTLRDCRSRIDTGISPPTHIANLIFILANETILASCIFPVKLTFSISSHLYDSLVIHEPALSFGWFTTTMKRPPNRRNRLNPTLPGERPLLEELTEAESALENVDPDDENEISEKLISQRMQFLAAQSPKESSKVGKNSVKDDESVMSIESTVKSKGKRRGALGTGKAKNGKSAADATEGFVDHSTPIRFSDVQYRSSLYRSSPLQMRQARLISAPMHRYSPYARSHERHWTNVALTRSPPRTLLEHAWHVVARTDPLADSDEEMEDEHCRNDYVQRLNIVCRLRGKNPTPEPE